MGTIEMLGIDLGMTAFGDSPVWSGEMPMERRPLLGSRVASAVCGSVSVTHHLVASRILIYSVFCFTSASQRRFADSFCDSP
ncbi:hypothetical protein HAX54_029678, partial [Datura stramonium]|nr:hypothetical protein [Datura stramonium]